MGLLSFLTGRGRPSRAAADQTVNPCRHPVLVPRWDRVQDMGVESKLKASIIDTVNADGPARTGFTSIVTKTMNRLTSTSIGTIVQPSSGSSLSPLRETSVFPPLNCGGLNAWLLKINR